MLTVVWKINIESIKEVKLETLSFTLSWKQQAFRDEQVTAKNSLKAKFGDYTWNGESVLGSVENCQDLLRVFGPVHLLTENFDVSQFAEVEVAFFLKTFDCQLRLHLQVQWGGSFSWLNIGHHYLYRTPLPSDNIKFLELVFCYLVKSICIKLGVMRSTVNVMDTLLQLGFRPIFVFEIRSKLDGFKKFGNGLYVVW